MGVMHYSAFELLWESTTTYQNRFYEYQSELDSEAERLAKNHNILTVAKRVGGVLTLVKKSPNSTASFAKET